MRPIDLSAGQSSRVGFTPASGSPDARWIRPDIPAYLPPPTRKSAVRGRTERMNASIVMVLMLICTALSLYDLLMLILGY